jgi:CDGSH-type Zn-finger protein
MTAKKDARIKVSKNGPYLVTGNVPLVKEVVVRARDGIPEEWKLVSTFPEKETYALCRCGRSQNAPYCDGAHVKNGFDGNETADHRLSGEQTTLVKGATIDMIDHKGLCMGAQFCHRAGGVRNLVAASDDPRKRELAIEVAGQCPSGRLITCEKDGTPIEPVFEKSISVTEDPGRRVGGPLWVKGGVPIESADGREYEVRNRVTLCRCGRSHNKPLCDGAHNVIGNQDGSD